jgi:hypothetical protein
MGTGSRLAGTAEQTRVIQELDITVVAGGRYQVEGTGRGSDWSRNLFPTSRQSNQRFGVAILAPGSR